MPLQIERAPLATLVGRLQQPRRFIQVVAGPRQVGKTTLVRQALLRIQKQRADQGLPPLPAHSISADSPGLPGRAWLSLQWELARTLADRVGTCILVLDEVQKIPAWTDEVKRLWDEDSAHGRDLRVVVLGSAPLLIARGLSESLAGRFEVTRLGHWRFAEMREAFDIDLDRFICYGGYPGAAALVADEARWAAYVRDALIETTIGKDVLLMAPVLKPALLRRLFELACRYSGQMLSYQKMLGQLGDAGNTTTLAHYLQLLEGAGMVCGLDKHAGQVVRQRASSPKLQVFNTALMGALAVTDGWGLARLRAEPAQWGRLVESAVGAELLARLPDHTSLQPRLRYWQEARRELDFVLPTPQGVFAIEVKSGARPDHASGLEAFMRAHPDSRPLVLGRGGLPLAEWFAGGLGPV